MVCYVWESFISFWAAEKWYLNVVQVLTVVALSCNLHMSLANICSFVMVNSPM